MFTGIIEELGSVARPGSHLTIACRTVLEDATVGSSIAVNGVCLTVEQIEADAFHASLSPETLARTNLGDLVPGAAVNLERPLALGARLSGHIVQGHVDGTAEFLGMRELGDGNWWLEVRIPPELDPSIIYKGSIAIDGVSLTVAALESGVVSIAIIPHTYSNTAFRALQPGARVNIEVDLIAKYVAKLTLTS